MRWAAACGVIAAAAALGVTLAVGFGAAQAPRVIRITAKKFEYEPPQIRLKRGETVVLELVTADRSHGFKLPELGIRLDALPEEVHRVALTPDRAGRFTFLCDVFCGEGHDDMEGHIVVEE
jgi:cytochrome c oxidase subunit II